MTNLRPFMSFSILVAVLLSTVINSPCPAMIGDSSRDKPKPSGTLLLPLNTKIDDSNSSPSLSGQGAPPERLMVPLSPKLDESAIDAKTPPIPSEQPAPLTGSNPPQDAIHAHSKTQSQPIEVQPSAELEAAPRTNISAESGSLDTDSSVGENTLLKGMVEITA